MIENLDQLSKELLSIFKKITENKIYGSVEIYFEGGQITQITQRIINKIHNGSSLKLNNTNRQKIETERTSSTENGQLN